jgi:uncharacterized protein YcbK (DUF882 family)
MIYPKDILPPDADINLFSNMDVKLLSAYEAIQAKFPGVYVNIDNGKRLYNNAGYRTPDCKTGAQYSAHKYGKALDLHHSTLILEEIRKFCKSAESLKLGIKKVEYM